MPHFLLFTYSLMKNIFHGKIHCWYFISCQFWFWSWKPIYILKSIQFDNTDGFVNWFYINAQQLGVCVCVCVCFLFFSGSSSMAHCPSWSQGWVYRQPWVLMQVSVTLLWLWWSSLCSLSVAVSFIIITKDSMQTQYGHLLWNYRNAELCEFSALQHSLL